MMVFEFHKEPFVYSHAGEKSSFRHVLDNQNSILLKVMMCDFNFAAVLRILMIFLDEIIRLLWEQRQKP